MKVEIEIVRDGSGNIDMDRSVANVASLIQARKDVEAQASSAIDRVFDENPGVKFSPMSLAVRTASMNMARENGNLSVEKIAELETAMNEYIARNGDSTGNLKFTIVRGKNGGVYRTSDRVEE